MLTFRSYLTREEVNCLRAHFDADGKCKETIRATYSNMPISLRDSSDADNVTSYSIVSNGFIPGSSECSSPPSQNRTSSILISPRKSPIPAPWPSPPVKSKIVGTDRVLIQPHSPSVTKSSFVRIEKVIWLLRKTKPSAPFLQQICRRYLQPGKRLRAVFAWNIAQCDFEQRKNDGHVQVPLDVFPDINESGDGMDAIPLGVWVCQLTRDVRSDLLGHLRVRRCQMTALTKIYSYIITNCCVPYYKILDLKQIFGRIS